MRSLSRGLLIGLAALLLAGCSGSSSPSARPSHLPSASPGESPEARLAALARVADTALYRARYQLRHARGGAFGTVTVYRSNLGIRLDITESGTTALAIDVHGTSYSCLVVHRRATCFVSARAGHPPPAFLDPGLENVFTRFLTVLATQPAGYTVTLAGATPSTGSLPAGTCFRITAPSSPRPAVVSAGIYCLSGGGVITRVRYASGELDLSALTGPPKPAQLRPPASPTALP